MRPSSRKPGAAWTTSVQDRKPQLASKLEPLALLMNYGGTSVAYRAVAEQCNWLTVVLPVPVGPITLPEGPVRNAGIFASFR